MSTILDDIKEFLKQHFDKLDHCDFKYEQTGRLRARDFVFILIAVGNWISAIVCQPFFCCYREMWYLTKRVFQVKGRQWSPNNCASNNANLFVEKSFFFFHWLSFSNAKTPNLSGSVCMPDYIFNSWEDIPKCALSPLLPAFWLTNPVCAFELTHACGCGKALMRIWLHILQHQRRTHGFPFQGMNIMKLNA